MLSLRASGSGWAAAGSRLHGGRVVFGSKWPSHLPWALLEASRS